MTKAVFSRPSFRGMDDRSLSIQASDLQKVGNLRHLKGRRFTGLAKAISKRISPCIIIQWATIIVLLLYTQSVSAQNMWLMNQRTHPELKWQTLETEHFNIHFHQGIETIAQKGAVIAEQVYQPILDQLEVKDFGKTDIVFSAEDEIMNGFAMPSNQIFIWVSQNDVAGHFGGSNKWLKLVIPHEFQHVVQFQAQRTWLGIIGGMSIPSWWLEGMAEYMTEVWRVGRSDSRMKIHTYRNTMNQLDAHDNGYAKVLYLAWKYGDSTLVKISKHRKYLQKKEHKYPYVYDFKAAFRESTGQTLASFEEEWRRVMNTYYYGYKSQKERIEEIGDPFLVKSFFTKVLAVSLSSDSSKIAVVGKQESGKDDFSLYCVSTDSIQKVEEIHHGRFSGTPAWSPDTKQIVISEYHRGRHGSLLYDLRLISLETKKKKWLTHNLRALHPVYAHDGKGVFFVAHPGETSQIYYLQLESGTRVQISQFEGDVQIQNLDLSPNGKKLAFMIQDTHGDVDIAIMNRDGSDFQKVTLDPEEDVFPVWTADESAIIYTSYRNSTPNLFRVDLDSLTVTQMTDVAEGIYSRQRLPNSNRIIASTLADVDTVRLRAVEADRVAPKLGLHIREPFKAWRTKSPDIVIPTIDPDFILDTLSVHRYQAFRTLRPLVRLVWPDIKGLFGMAIYTDALGKHIIQGGAVLGWEGSIQGGYVSYLNLKYKPAIHLFASKDLAFNLRQSFDHLFVERRNGGGVSLQLPMNTGRSLSSNHSLRLSTQAFHRKLFTSPAPSDLQSTSNVTESSSTELNLSMTYMWKSQRPQKDEYILPRDGLGFLICAETTVPEIYGGNDYSQFWIEGFFNYEIPKSPLVLYSRAKWIGQSGSILAQDEIGFSETPPIYFSNAYLSTLKGIGLFDTPESYSLRGQVSHYPGRKLIYSVNELRLPFLKHFPLQVLGFGIQNMTVAAFFDYGYLPESDQSLDTYGAELKFDLSFMKLSLITLAVGYGGDTDYWSRGWDDRDGYLRMALVNPF